MQYTIDHADEIDKLLKVKAQVSQVKSIMLENIDKVFTRNGVISMELGLFPAFGCFYYFFYFFAPMFLLPYSSNTSFFPRAHYKI